MGSNSQTNIYFWYVSLAKIIDFSLIELSFVTNLSPGAPTDLGQNRICYKYGCIRILDLSSAVEFNFGLYYRVRKIGFQGRTKVVFGCNGYKWTVSVEKNEVTYQVWSNKGFTFYFFLAKQPNFPPCRKWPIIENLGHCQKYHTALYFIGNCGVDSKAGISPYFHNIVPP